MRLNLSRFLRRRVVVGEGPFRIDRSGAGRSLASTLADPVGMVGESPDCEVSVLVSANGISSPWYSSNTAAAQKG